MNIIFVIALVVKLSGAMVTRNVEGNNQEPTTLPTDLYKPLTPLKDKTTPTSSPVTPSLNYDKPLGEAFGSSFYMQHNEGDNESGGESQTGLNFPTRAKYSSSFPGNINGFAGISQLPTNHPIGHSSGFHEMSAPFPHQMQPAQATYLSRFLNRDPFSQADQDFPPFSNFGTDAGNNHYQVSSSHTYFNSDTMAAPMTQNYHYDSRNGGPFGIN